MATEFPWVEVTPLHEETILAHDVAWGGKRIEALLVIRSDALEVQIRFYEGGKRVDGWQHTYTRRRQSYARTGYDTGREAAERWFNGERLTDLRPNGWRRSCE